MLALIALAATGLTSAAGYLKTRSFVRGRLRFVDATQRATAPWIAGAAAAAAAAPVVWLLPLVGGGAAIAFGIAVGAGVAHGARDVRRLAG